MPEGETCQESNSVNSVHHHDGCMRQVDIFVTPGAHSTEAAVNKQLNDKERVAAALENPSLLDMVNKSLASCH